jgi:rhamnosyltransferase subunit B
MSFLTIVARIVFTTFGSLGDLHPMMPVADRLRVTGHNVVFAVPAHMREVVAREGYRGVLIPSPPTAVHGGARPPSPSTLIKERFPSLLAGAVAALDSVCGAADLIVSHPLQLATPIVARRHRLPWASLTVFPGFIPSAYTVPQPHWLPALPTPAGRAVNRLTWRVYRYALRHLAGEALPLALATQGVTRESDVFEPGGLSPYLTVVLTSPVYSPRLADWPPSVKLVGFTPWDEPRGWTQPAGVEAFLASGPPPVVVTTSSAGERDANSFFIDTAKALAATGRRAILLTGNLMAAGSGGAELAPGVVSWPYLPLSSIASRSSFVIHHAGIATTLTTIRSGRACIALPATFDQWYNAGRIRSLRAGRVLEFRKFTAKRLIAEMAALEAGPYGGRARDLAEQMAPEDGAACAASEIETVLVSSDTKRRGAPRGAPL